MDEVERTVTDGVAHPSQPGVGYLSRSTDGSRHVGGGLIDGRVVGVVDDDLTRGIEMTEVVFELLNPLCVAEHVHGHLVTGAEQIVPNERLESFGYRETCLCFRCTDTDGHVKLWT